jgi:hypothetical protein
MNKTYSNASNQPGSNKKSRGIPVFNILAGMFLVTVAGSVIIFSQYHPAASAPKSQITFEQKMVYLEAGMPLPQQETSREIPRWLLVIVLGFVVLQIIPLLLASHKARASEFTSRDLRQIEFLTETPLYLGLLGSLLGVCMTQFISGSLAAPIAYLTTISGILLYLFGRFTIYVSLPSTTDIA